MIVNIARLLRSCSTSEPLFPPTVLYNEGWMLRLVLEWFSTHRGSAHPLAFEESARWFSEAYLPSAFLPRRRGDPLGENHTHADGVIGHFDIAEGSKADLRLVHPGLQLVVLEAKMFARLSTGVSHAKYFDQAARTVACIAKVIARSGQQPKAMRRLGFRVIAPEEQVESGVFWRYMRKQSIQRKVERRVRCE